jgi:hypothetical protein
LQLTFAGPLICKTKQTKSSHPVVSTIHPNHGKVREAEGWSLTTQSTKGEAHPDVIKFKRAFATFCGGEQGEQEQQTAHFPFVSKLFVAGLLAMTAFVIFRKNKE